MLHSLPKPAVNLLPRSISASAGAGQLGTELILWIGRNQFELQIRYKPMPNTSTPQPWRKRSAPLLCSFQSR